MPLESVPLHGRIVVFAAEAALSFIEELSQEYGE